MRNILLILLMLNNVTFVNGQNLVLNPGFDSYITCPGSGQFSSTYINDWNKPTVASSDYYHFNCLGIQPSVQAPLSGEGYAGIIAYNFGTEYREYITGTLSSPLIAGQTYNVEFYVSLNNGYIQAIVEMGAYLSATPPGPFSNALHISVVPQIENNTASLQDTMNWKKVSGQFVAVGGEQFITIGNFNDDANTTITQPGSSGSFGAYYFIEDVSVTLDSTTSVNHSLLQPQLQVLFSGASLYLNVTNIPNNIFPLQLYGYNLIGQEVVSAELKNPIETISGFLEVGSVYYFTITKNGKYVAGAKLFYFK